MARFDEEGVQMDKAPKHDASLPAWPPSEAPEELAHAIQASLADPSLTREDRLCALASAFVIEALAPYWAEGRTAADAHEVLVRAEGELAQIVETMAPAVLGRIEVRQVATEAIASVEAMLGLPPRA